MVDEIVLFTPKSQKQYDLIWSDTDITFFGGSAGAGKSFNSLLRFLRYVDEPLYRGYVIRKTQVIREIHGGALRGICGNRIQKLIPRYQIAVNYPRTHDRRTPDRLQSLVQSRNTIRRKMRPINVS